MGAYAAFLIGPQKSYMQVQTIIFLFNWLSKLCQIIFLKHGSVFTDIS